MSKIQEAITSLTQQYKDQVIQRVELEAALKDVQITENKLKGSLEILSQLLEQEKKDNTKKPEE